MLLGLRSVNVCLSEIYYACILNYMYCDVVVDEFLQVKKENEQLKDENMRFRSIIDNAGLYILNVCYLCAFDLYCIPGKAEFLWLS